LQKLASLTILGLTW